MKNKLILPILSITLLSCCLFGCNKNNNNKGDNDVEPVVLPDAFKNRNFCNVVVAGYFDGGAALIFDDKLNADIQNVSYHVDFYSVQYEAKPITKKGNMYFFPFKVTDQIIEDGYFKNNTEYKFWLSYENSTYYCGVSLNDDSLTEPTATLMEGTM